MPVGPGAPPLGRRPGRLPGREGHRGVPLHGTSDRAVERYVLQRGRRGVRFETGREDRFQGLEEEMVSNRNEWGLFIKSLHMVYHIHVARMNWNARDWASNCEEARCHAGSTQLTCHLGAHHHVSERLSEDACV